MEAEEQDLQQENQQTMGKTNPTLALGVDMFPPMANAKPGQMYRLNVKAKVTPDKQLEILSVDDQDFKKKSYSDIVEEDMETAPDDERAE